MKANKIKRVWQKINHVPDLNIERISSRQSRDAFRDLLQHERSNINMCISMPVLIIGIFFFNKSISLLPLVLAGAVLLVTFWQYYKYRFLKKMCIAEIDTILRLYSVFKNYIKWEIAVVSICVVILYSIFGYFKLFLMWDMQSTDFILIFIGSVLGMLFFISLLVLYYIFVYRVPLRNFEKALKEE